MAWLPLFTWLFMSPADPGDKTRSTRRAIVLQSLERSWGLIKSERSALWSTIYYALTVGKGKAEKTEKTDMQAEVKGIVRENVLWNLQTWADELIDWPNDNDERKDILYENTQTRFNVPHIESLKSRPPLPTNERRQYRWNANPYVVGPPGGAGTTEGDPGAWLLPYWMGRWSGVLNGED